MLVFYYNYGEMQRGQKTQRVKSWGIKKSKYRKMNYVKREYRNFVKIYRKKSENVFKIGLKYTVESVCYIIINKANLEKNNEGRK